MAWDFSTEPEFEEKLEWMRGFVREEVYPLETLDLTYDQVRVLIRPLRSRSRRRGCGRRTCRRSWGAWGSGRCGWG